MADYTELSKKIVLKYDSGSFSFDKILLSSNETKMYALATAINSMQEEKPPVEILCVTTNQLI